MATKRKLAAILAADAAGYSRLMADDEAATLRSLNESRMVFRAHIEGHGGRLIDTAGDSILAEFVSPVEATSAAAEIQRALHEMNAPLPTHRRMQFRIGINLGDVIEQEDGTIYGDGVNVAARLQELSEPGGLCISGPAYDQVEGKLPLAFKSIGEQPVKNIAKPVRAYRVILGVSAGKSRRSYRDKRRSLAIGVATIVVVLVTAGIVWKIQEPVADQGLSSNDSSLAMPSGPSIAVLPFTNMSGDPKEDYFSDGLTEDIITELARFKDLYVLARNTTFQYKGKAVDIVALGKKLGARYVLEGSVRRSGEQLRITAQLIDVSNGAHIWADKYNRSMRDIFAIQEDLANKIAAMIAGGDLSVLRRAAIRSSFQASPNELKAYDHLLRAAVFDASWSKENYDLALVHLKKAIKIAPDNARARQQYAYTLLIGWVSGLDEAPAPGKEIRENAIRSLQLDPNDPRAHRTAAAGYFFDKQLTRFAEEAQIAIALSPNDAQMLAELGALFAFSGDWKRGIAWSKKAKSLNAQYAAGWYHSAIHYDLYRQGKYRESLGAVLAHPEQHTLHTQWKYVPLYGELGDREKAREHWKKCVEIDPDWSVARLIEHLRLWNVPESLIGRYVDGYAKAGYSVEKP